MPYRSKRTAILFAALLLLTATACFGEQKSTPEWIWPVQARQPHQTAHFRKSFSIDRELQNAELRAFADFNDATFILNGKRIADMESYGPLVTIDVTSFVKQGENILTAKCISTQDPAAIAADLVLRFKNGSEQRIVTDTAWSAEIENDRKSSNPSRSDDGNKAVSFGKVAAEFWNESSVSIKIDEFDDYTQWKQALGTEDGSDPSSFLVPEGFEFELLRTARPEEGSWVSLAFDPRGRLTIAREDKGLLRLTFSGEEKKPVRVETINDTLQECRGLLYAYDSLYVNANNSKGLYCLRDTNGDDRFDEVKLLYHSPGGVGHGRNDLALGPDGMIYSIHGDAVDLPVDFADATSPFRGHRRGVKTREGHVIRTDRDGKQRELVAGGLRNPYGIDFNTDGEMFTYDADAEHDMGAPWYRPTRVVQLVSGADYGWRGVTGRWPPYYPDHPDNGLPSFDIGKGSPTGVKFGTKSNFPPKFRRALFILDWAYGRILAVHMTPRGSGYLCAAETFVKGRPMNVTDLGFGPDGAMYVVTGGRKTKAALYRIRYIGPETKDPPKTRQQQARIEFGTSARKLRRRLESLHGSENPQAVEIAWPHLDSPDPRIRHAARIAVEHQPLAEWEQRALDEPRPKTAITALLAPARSGSEPTAAKVVARLNQMPLTEMPTSWKLTALYIYRLCLDAIEKPDAKLLAEIRRKLDPLFPDVSLPAGQTAQFNRELSRLMIHIGAPGAVEKTVALLTSAKNQADELHYLFVLRNVEINWTPEDRQAYFAALRRTRYYLGGEGMPKFIQQIRDEAMATLTKQERKELASLLTGPNSTQSDDDTIINRPLVREWKSADLADALSKVSRGRDFERGRQLFSEALCIRCHRMRADGHALGPDLTFVSRRFSRKDILESILSPSKVVAEKYRNMQIVTREGKVIVGSIVPGGDYRSPVLRIAVDPLHPNKIVEVPKKAIDSHRLSDTSAMPKGLLNTLKKEEILDLLSYIESGGDRNHPVFQE